ncbi:MAG: hypothetical protein V5B32_05990 [Candidatus Accumulibacter sp. UW26]
MPIIRQQIEEFEEKMGRASRRKAIRHSPSAIDQAKSAVQRVLGTKDVHIISDLPVEQRISYALSRLLRPEVPVGSPLEDYQTVLTIVATAWNLSLLDSEQRSAALKSLIPTRKGLDESYVRQAREHIEQIIARKQALFPDDKRHVLSWNARLEGDEVRIVAAAIERPPQA